MIAPSVRAQRTSARLHQSLRAKHIVMRDSTLKRANTPNHPQLLSVVASQSLRVTAFCAPLPRIMRHRSIPALKALQTQ